jgi:phosphatidate phosphatase APP1
MRIFVIFSFWLLLVQGLPRAEALTVVTDLDDTIKQTNVGSKFDAVCNGLLSIKPFGGMATLYKMMTSNLVIVSGKPENLRDKVEKFVSLNQFQQAEAFLRPSLFSDLADFKSGALENVLQREPGPFIFVGDDTQMDPEIMSKLKGRFGDKVLATYIRPIQFRKLPEGVSTFFHPFEIAANEWLAGRMSRSDLLKFARQTIVEMRSRPDLYYPKYAYCPSAKGFFNLKSVLESGDLAVERSAQTIIDMSVAYCLERLNK